MRTLNDRHRTDLKSSGLTDETIERSEIFSASASETRAILGFPAGPGSGTLRDRMLRAKLPCRHSAEYRTGHLGATGHSRFDLVLRRGTRAGPRGNVQERHNRGAATTEGGLAG